MATAPERSLGGVGRAALVGLLVAGTAWASLDAFTFVFFLSYAAVGTLLVIRRPSNAIGWLVLVIAFGLVGTTVPRLDVVALKAGTASTRDFVIAWFSGSAGSVSYVAFLSLAIVFPSGHLPAGRWRRPAATLIAVGVALIALAAVAPTFSVVLDGSTSVLVPNRFAVAPWLPVWSLMSPDSTGLLLILALLTVGVGGSLIRYHGSTGIVRLQLRWLLSAVLFVIVAAAFGLGVLAIFGEASGGFGWLPAIVAYPTVPLAIWIAVTRYRLLEIDRIISRTLAYVVVTGVLTIVFIGIVLGLQAALAGLTAGDTLAVATSTLVVAALFQPIRARVQHAADRRFNRSRYDAERTVESFAARLRDEVNLDRLDDELLTVVERTVAPSHSQVWLRGADR